MPKLTRRKLIAGAAAAPLALNGAARRALARAARAAKADPVVMAVEAWLAERDAHDAMTLEWSKLESRLLAKTRGKLDLARAARSKLPEAQAMRALDKRIAASWKRLERSARAIVLMRPSSAAGALAKLRMGLRIQGPYDWEDYAFALAQDGCEQLALMLARAG